MKLSNLLPSGSYRSSIPAEEIEIHGLSEHTSEIEPNSAFIARKSESFDPLHFLSRLEKEGIKAIVLEEGHSLPYHTDIPCFFVKDIEKTSAILWSNYYGSPQNELSLVGITGTNGKTTTALILSHLLNASERKCGYIGTLGVISGKKSHEELKEGNMTTPSPRYLFRALRTLCEEGCKYAVLEVSSHALVQKRVLPLSFTVSVFTNLSEDHLDYHGSMEEYLKAKMLIFRQSSHALINLDDPCGKEIYQQLLIPKTSFGIFEYADHTLTDLNERSSQGTHYTYQSPDGSFPIKTSLVGTFNLYNALAATATATLLGLSSEEIQRAHASLPPIKGRMERLPVEKYGASFSVIIDYAHTPNAMEAAIRCAKKFTRGRVIAVFGAGGDREKEKRSKMGKIAERFADFSIVTTDNSRGETPLCIIRDILEGMPKQEKRRVISSRKSAIEAALSCAKEGDTVLLLGKGHEEYLIQKDGSIPFSEREIVDNFLSKRGTL